MTLNPGQVFDEITHTTEKLYKGYEALQDMNEVEVATTPKELVFQKDKVKIYHYLREGAPVKCKIPVLVSFAMLNRHDVLDLQPDKSLMKKFVDLGLDVYIMDWGYPTQADKYLTMEDYIDGYMNDAVDFIRRKHKVPKIHKMAICQAGTYSMIYASRYPEKLQTLTTYVAPFDFGSRDNMLYKWAKYMDVDAMVDSVGTIPGEMIDSAFSMLKPSMNISKYLGIMDSLDDKDKMANFMRMEKWKADLPAIAGEMYRKYIKDLFQGNKLINGEMELGNKKIDLKNMTVPYLNVYATGDTIIPNNSTLAIMDKIGTKDKTEYAFPGGHIGVFVGGKSQKELAPTVTKWVMERTK
ncbi:MAG: class III poly(R)-hydroxyalkanoic acid synthase subunit PhaC [Bacteroidetes bacterium 43-16]|nr:MAG: class III poly(R)-hydroxyalkanoic acid synthase subunit PhaC [Bacteroidetes bacterium 43-16]